MQPFFDSYFLIVMLWQVDGWFSAQKSCSTEKQRLELAVLVIDDKEGCRIHGKCLWDTDSINGSKSTITVSEGGTDFKIELCTTAKSNLIPKPLWGQTLCKSQETCLNLMPGVPSVVLSEWTWMPV